MPIYTFRCEDGHNQDLIFSMANRPASVACKECDNDATPVVERTPISQVNRSHTWGKAIEPSGDRQRLYEFQCELGHTTDEWFTKAPNTCPCEEEGCELEARRVYTSMINRWWLEKEREGGYYDRGLGRVITSEAHRREVMKELGVVAVDGDFDQDEVMRPAVEEDRKSAEHYQEYWERVQHAPEYKDFRKAVRQGRVDNLPDPDLAEHFDS